jgi:hypothetical protein
MLGAVTGLAVSTAVQHAVTESALPGSGNAAVSTSGRPDLLSEAKMKGIRAVFIIMVPLITLCGVGCFFIPNVVLLGDERQVVVDREREHSVASEQCSGNKSGRLLKALVHRKQIYIQMVQASRGVCYNPGFLIPSSHIIFLMNRTPLGILYALSRSSSSDPLS